MKIDLNRCRESFFREAGESVAQMKAELVAIAEGNSDPELPCSVCRAARSLEGMAGTFGLLETAEFAHAIGRCLVAVDRNRISLLLEAVDVLAALLATAASGVLPPRNCGAVRAGLNAVRTPTAAGAASPSELRRLDAAVFMQGVDPALVVQALNQLATH